MRKLLVALGGLFLCLAANAQNVAIGSLTAQGVDCTTAGACITLQFDSNDPASASIQLSGTFTATVQFEASSDKGTTWVAISGTPLNSSTAVTSATTANTWKFNVASLTNIRARASAWTSAPTVVIRSSRAVANAIGGGGAVYASGLGTVNVIPKGNGAGQLADSSCTDNATTVNCTEPFLLPVGIITSPALQWAESGANAGIYRNTTNIYEFSIGNSNTVMRWQTGSPAVVVKNTFGFANGNTASTTADLLLTWKAAASLQFGAADAAAPVAQTMGPQSTVAGTSNIAGARWTLRPSLGTGNAAGSAIAIQRSLMLGSGTTQQSATDAFVVGQSKTLSNTTATAQSLATISVPSNSAGGSSGTINVNCSDGTNFDSETQSFNVSYVNKATVLTVGTPAITASTAANNSGSCTIGLTVVAGTNAVDIKVTPAFTTIVPTTVTGTVLSLSSYATGNVTIN